MTIGVSDYSFSQYIKSGKIQHVQVVEKAKEIGFDAIEFVGLNPPPGMGKMQYAGHLREKAEKHHIEISAYVVSGDLAKRDASERALVIESIKEELHIAKCLGAKFFRHDVMYHYAGFRSFDEALPYIAEAVREITEYGEILGIQTMVENHGLVLQEPERLESLVHRVHHENFGLLLDIGNFMCADLEPPYAVARLCNLAFMVHAKDFIKTEYYNVKELCGFETRAGNRLCGTTVGEGDAKAKQCIHALKRFGYNGFIDVEFEGEADCVESLTKSLLFLKQITASL